MNNANSDGLDCVINKQIPFAYMQSWERSKKCSARQLYIMAQATGILIKMKDSSTVYTETSLESLCHCSILSLGNRAPAAYTCLSMHILFIFCCASDFFLWVPACCANCNEHCMENEEVYFYPCLVCSMVSFSSCIPEAIDYNTKFLWSYGKLRSCMAQTQIKL
jgi:hypothetical protein